MNLNRIDLNRRAVLAASSAALLASPSKASPPVAAPTTLESESTIGLSFGTYGMKSLAPERALQICAEIGYDGVELALLDGWPTAPRVLGKANRKALRTRFSELGLALPALLQSLPCLRTKQSHQQNLEKLKRACELGRELSTDDPPVVQSIVGAKPGQWAESKQQLVDELSDWARVGESNRIVVCFKPHAGHVIQLPENAIWMHRQVDSPWLKIVYDYSHYALSKRSLSATLETLLPITSFVQVKDSSGTSDKPRYLLPGDGETDYPELLSTLRRSDYRGFVGVEVSSQIHRQPGYDPVSTAKLCYERLAPVFAQAGIRRPKGD